MNKKMGFWVTWASLTLMIIWFYATRGELENVDFWKAVILTISVLLPAYPIKLWVKSNTDFFED